jgi:hypothetical protein
VWTGICPISGSGSSPTYCQFVCLSSLCLLKVCAEFSSLPLLPSLVHSVYSVPSAACPLQFLVYYLFFFVGWGSVCPGAMLVYPRGACGSIMCHLFAHLFVCVSHAGLELASGSTGALLVSQCNVVWRSFVRAGGSGCWSFAYSWCFFFFCQVLLQHLSKIFDLRSSHFLLPPSSHHLGSSSSLFCFILCVLRISLTYDYTLGSLGYVMLL